MTSRRGSRRSEERELAINGRFLSQQTTGVQRVARELTRAIDRLMLAGEHRGCVRLVCEDGASVEDLGLKRIEIDVRQGLRGYAWEQGVLPIAQGRADLLCLGNTAPLASLLGPRRTGVLIHDLSYLLFPGAYRQLYRSAHRAMLPLLLQQADPILTVSESERAMLLRLAPKAAGRIVVAQNGGWRDDEPLAAPSIRPLESRDYALYVGSLSTRKNVSRVLEAAVALARSDGVTTQIVGSTGHILRSPGISIPADVADRVRLVGQVEQVDRLAELYAGARCLLFPSLYEASPLPPIEAMRFGCPVVASDLPPIRERCGDAVLYCDPGSTDDIVGAVRRVFRDGILAASLVERGLACSARYSWREQARTILAAMAGDRLSEDPALG